ncbi:hypothetical protein ACYE2N_11465 [Flavobacterium sp. MAHUQ-51]|uniref:hypothetical protein n=1 Tax=Flavobacterium sp. GCM10022190 TaxID=3252639 RepID=UPI0036145908
MANNNSNSTTGGISSSTTNSQNTSSATQQSINSSTLQYLNHIQQQQSILENRINTSSQELTNIKNDIKNQSTRNIEVIGIFSSVLALLIINVNIVASAKDILSAILLIIGLTASVSIFALLIHYFFNTHVLNPLNKFFWIPVTVLGLLLIVGILAEMNIFKMKKFSSEETNEKENIIINNKILGQKNQFTSSNDTIKNTNHQLIIVKKDSVVKKQSQ